MVSGLQKPVERAEVLWRDYRVVIFLYTNNETIDLKNKSLQFRINEEMSSRSRIQI